MLAMIEFIGIYFRGFGSSQNENGISEDFIRLMSSIEGNSGFLGDTGPEMVKFM